MKSQATNGVDFWHGEKRSCNPIGQEGLSFLALYLRGKELFILNVQGFYGS